VSQETLDRTTLGDLDRGAAVNLEPALTLNQPLGGHIVTGHVDGVAEVRSVAEDGTYRRLKIEVPSDLARYSAEKGSVCVDGVSLTVNAVEGSRFQVMIVPHSLQNTIIGNYSAGSAVNIEVDMIARYLERILQYTDLSGKAERAD
jgi:riboflavin synthase